MTLGDRRLSTLLFSALIVLSWLTLWVWSQSSSASYLNHLGVNHVLLGHRSPAALVFFAAGWMLMTIAMMLPTAMPLAGLFQSMVGGRANAARLLGLLIAGYVGVWTVFGFIAHAAVAGLQIGFQQLSAASNQVGFRTTLLLIAGIYQFTPLKYHCLAKCRSPLAFILERWHGINESKESFRIGFDHGIYCIGCCWSLMLLMFLAAGVDIAWMLVLGTVMAIEKNMPWGRRFGKPLGILLVAAGLLLLAAEFAAL